MPSRQQIRDSRPSIRRIAIATAIVFGMLELGVVVAQVWTATLLRRATETATLHNQRMASAGEAQLTLLSHQRLSHLYVLTMEPELARTRRDLAFRIQSLLAAGTGEVRDVLEDSLLARARAGVARYLEESAQIEAPGAVLADVVRLTRPSVNDALANLEALRDRHAVQVRAAHARALRLDALSNATGVAAVVLFVLGLVTVVWGVRRYLLRPMMSLHEAVTRFRSGDTNARAPETGSYESVELARAFNDMLDAVARQRESRLAFLAGVAHDLRNPLSGLKLGIAVLAQTDADPRHRRTFVMLDRQADHLARMVNDLLDATRIEAGKLEMHVESVDLCQVVQDIVQLQAPTSERHDLAVELPPGPVVVRGDRLRLEQVLTNLVTNAIKFTPNGGRIDVVVRIENAQAVLAVHDRGIGIPADEIGDLFMPFRRHRPDVAAGAGIGLSVVRRIVTAHAGTIDVESTPGKGTTFRVRLPCEPRGTYDSRHPVARASLASASDPVSVTKS